MASLLVPIAPVDGTTIRPTVATSPMGMMATVSPMRSSPRTTRTRAATPERSAYASVTIARMLFSRSFGVGVSASMACRSVGPEYQLESGQPGDTVSTFSPVSPETGMNCTFFATLKPFLARYLFESEVSE